MKKISLLVTTSILSSLFFAQVLAATNVKESVKNSNKPSFEQYVMQLKNQAQQNEKFNQTIVKQAFAQIKFYKRAVKADRSQPEKVETLDTYLPKRLPKWKIDKARKLFKQHQKMLTKIGEQYGVQPRFIIALWGLETNFGKYTGNYNVVSALATLAYEGRRETFFKKQLWAALQILSEGHISPDKMIGSWAGAMGQNQFMPTSFLAYAVDGDGDGKKDIWTNTADVFASIANYLKQEGWNDELTWGRQVKLPDNFDTSLAIPKNTGSRKKWLAAWKLREKSLAQWQKLGVRRTDGTSLPIVDIRAVLVFPDDIHGRAYLAYNNYKSLMHWNLSYYFVSSVGHLADRIKFPPIK
ncbi:MAG: lytic transglycosylase [Gammaproteobacteria bacterium]|nr:MAG: lytic transglycosylase [Gammaproteobacteria bacterium]